MLGNKVYFHAKLFHCFSPPTWVEFTENDWSCVVSDRFHSKIKDRGYRERTYCFYWYLAPIKFHSKLAVELGSWEIVAVSAKEVTEQCGKRRTKGDGEGSIMTRRQLSPYKP